MTGHDETDEIGAVLDQPSVAAAFLAAAETYGDRVAIRQHGADRSLTSTEWAAAAGQVADGLAALGVAPGSPVALLLDDDADFPVADMEAVVRGAVPFSLSNTAPVQQLLENVDDSEPPVGIAGAAYVEVARDLVRRRPEIVRHLVVVPADGVPVDPDCAVPGELTFDALRAGAAPDFDARAAAEAVAPSDLVEFYGSSGSISATSNPPASMRLGTAGTALPGTELRLADDGEVLLRGPNITPGSLKDPVRTAEAIDADGWLHTGDVGTLDDAGHLRIVDRRKDIIINSAGKNTSPANIESAIKLGAPLIAQVVCVGDARPYDVALVVLDGDALDAFAARHDLHGTTPAELADDPVLRAELERIVAAGNARLSRVEQIKRFSVVPAEWAPGGEELTATGKLERRSVTARYAEDIDALYAPAHAPAGTGR